MRFEARDKMNLKKKQGDKKNQIKQLNNSTKNEVGFFLLYVNIKY